MKTNNSETSKGSALVVVLGILSVMMLMAVAFSMYPTSIAELFAVADAGRLMPPKSSWFEPKLRSGLFLHELG